MPRIWKCVERILHHPAHLMPTDAIAHQYLITDRLAARIRLHERFSQNPQGLHNWFFNQVNLKPNARILELGCGTCTLWKRVLDKVPATWHMTMTDASEAMVNAAEQLLGKDPRFADFCVVDAVHIPYPDASFDAVFAHFILYHVENRSQAISEIRRVLKPGGTLYAMTYGQQHMKELHDLTERFDPPIHYGQDGHYDFYLENGESLLRNSFPHVRCIRYEDHLEVTESGPLIDYVFSTIAAESLTHEVRSRFSEYAADIFTHEKVFRITKDAGLFIAS